MTMAPLVGALAMNRREFTLASSALALAALPLAVRADPGASLHLP
jgi:hypothetical protein